jgi:hypothetical protein
MYSTARFERACNGSSPLAFANIALLVMLAVVRRD